MQSWFSEGVLGVQALVARYTSVGQPGLVFSVIVLAVSTEHFRSCCGGHHVSPAQRHPDALIGCILNTHTVSAGSGPDLAGFLEAGPVHSAGTAACHIRVRSACSEKLASPSVLPCHAAGRMCTLSNTTQVHDGHRPHHYHHSVASSAGTHTSIKHTGACQLAHT